MQVHSHCFRFDPITRGLWHTQLGQPSRKHKVDYRTHADGMCKRRWQHKSPQGVQERVLTVSIGHAGFEKMIHTKTKRSTEAKNENVGVGSSDEHADRNEDENDQTVAPELLHQDNGEERRASKDRAMHVRPNGASCTNKDKSPPEQTCCALAHIEPGGERGVKLHFKRHHVQQHLVSEWIQGQKTVDQLQSQRAYHIIASNSQHMQVS